ncbi:hypothetical protein [Saccharothrix stipae]
MDIRHAVPAATLAGLVAAGITLTGATASAAPIEVDGVSIAVLESADYMPPTPEAPVPDAFTVDGVTVTVLESADYMPPEA